MMLTGIMGKGKENAGRREFVVGSRQTRARENKKPLIFVQDERFFTAMSGTPITAQAHIAFDKARDANQAPPVTFFLAHPNATTILASGRPLPASLLSSLFSHCFPRAPHFKEKT